MITPQDLKLPIEQWRPGQFEAILNSLGSKKRFVVHSAPTGSGKSTIVMAEALMSKKRTLILVGSKEQQNQYSKAYQHLGVVDVRGKSNYNCRATELGGEHYDGSTAKSVDVGPCQFGMTCGLKEYGCIYYDKVRSAGRTKIVIANYAAYISAGMYTEGWGDFDLVVLDECHEAEQWLRSMLTITWPKHYVDAVQTAQPASDDPNEWVKWAYNVLPSVKEQLRAAKKREPTRRTHAKQMVTIATLAKAERLLVRIQAINEGWKIVRDRAGTIFTPVWVRNYAEGLLFGYAPKVVLTSATVVPYTLGLLGISMGNTDFFSYPSSFPIKRRPIYFYPVVKMNYSMDEEDTAEWLSVADAFISTRLDRKGFIPTVSFVRQQLILQRSKYSSLMVANTKSIAQGTSSTSSTVLQKFRVARPPAILVTPSMGTGISLDYRQCEYIIAPKVPWGNFTDPVAQAQAETQPHHGAYEAAQSLVQFIGRAMRAADDQCETLITDATFARFLGQYKHFIPKWVHDAIITVDELPAPLERLK